VVTYVGWYVLAALLLAAGVVFWVEIHRRKEGADRESAERPSNFKARLAEFFREGDELRGECATVPDGPPDAKLTWAIIGGTPQEQCGREEKARDWDARVSTLLWSDPQGKALAPGWKAAGSPPGKAPDHPDQSMMNPARLEEWYQGKLAYLTAALDEKPRETPPHAHGGREAGQQTENRVYGGAAAGEAVRNQREASERQAIFIAVEGEISLASEEAMEMASMLRAEWPHIAPDGALVEAVLPDWREKTTGFIAAVLGSANRAAFKASATGTDTLERLDSEGRFLVDLAQKLTPDAVRTNEEETLEARDKRRRHEAAKFLKYDNYRPPGAPPPLADELDSLIREGKELVAELSIPVQPERLNWVSKIVGGGPPAEWQEKADAFRQRSMDLLEARHPALVTDLRDGVKRHFEMEQEAKEKREREAKADTRSDGEKMLALANFERSGPRREVEAWLEGLALARKSI
jgi:hypothetical protein